MNHKPGGVVRFPETSLALKFFKRAILGIVFNSHESRSSKLPLHALIASRRSL